MGMATWITDTALTAAVARANATDPPTALSAHLAGVIPAANTRAYNRIRSLMAARGFTFDQLDQWDDNEDWNETVGVCFAFWAASKGEEDRGEAFRREWDSLKEELNALVVTIGGVVVSPSARVSSVGSGDFDTSEDTFTMDTTL